MQDATLGGCSRLPFPLWQPDRCTGPSASPLLPCARAPHAHTACWAQRALRAGEARLGSRDAALIFAELRPGGAGGRACRRGTPTTALPAPVWGGRSSPRSARWGIRAGSGGHAPRASGPALGFGRRASEAKAAAFPGLAPPLGPVGIFSPESPERPEGTGCRVQLMEAKGPHAFCG